MGILFGLIILAIGLFFIFGKDFLWSVTQAVYSMFGIQAARTRGWELLTTFMGLGIGLFGAFVTWAVVMVVKNAASGPPDANE